MKESEENASKDYRPGYSYFLIGQIYEEGGYGVDQTTIWLCNGI